MFWETSGKCPGHLREISGKIPAGVKTEEIRKGRVLAGLRDIWKVFQKSFPYTNPRKNVEKPKKKQEKRKKNFEKTSLSLFFLSFSLF